MSWDHADLWLFDHANGIPRPVKRAPTQELRACVTVDFLDHGGGTANVPHRELQPTRWDAQILGLSHNAQAAWSVVHFLRRSLVEAEAKARNAQQELDEAERVPR